MRTSIIVQNLKCGGCANTITSKLSQLKNINDLLVDTETSSVSFQTESINDLIIVKEKLKTLGYPSVDDDNGVLTKAKSYLSCATGKIK
jgi:copper chaperone CopZ